MRRPPLSCCRKVTRVPPITPSLLRRCIHLRQQFRQDLPQGWPLLGMRNSSRGTGCKAWPPPTACDFHGGLPGSALPAPFLSSCIGRWISARASRWSWVKSRRSCSKSILSSSLKARFGSWCWCGFCSSILGGAYAASIPRGGQAQRPSCILRASGMFFAPSKRSRESQVVFSSHFRSRRSAPLRSAS